MNKGKNNMMGLLLAFGIFIAVVAICFISVNKREKIIREGRPILAVIERVRPVSTDDSGNTTVAYTLNVEGRKIEGREKIDTFYAPQMQPGMQIKIMYVDDKHFVFMFDK
jgi:hypothetical protein